MVYKIITFTLLVLSIVWMTVAPGFEPMIAVVASIASYLRDEIYGFVGLNFLSLTPKNQIIRKLTEAKFSFTTPEFIHPKIIEELEGWISDIGDQVVAVNITNSNVSNRYFGKVDIQQTGGHPVVTCNEGKAYFEYQYIGRSFSGIHIIQTWSSGGGSGIFCRLIFVILTCDTAIDYDKGKLVGRDRFVVKKVGSLPLGDRYAGNISYNFGFLYIRQCPNQTEIMKKGKFILVL